MDEGLNLHRDGIKNKKERVKVASLRMQRSHRVLSQCLQEALCRPASTAVSVLAGLPKAGGPKFLPQSSSDTIFSALKPPF